MKENQPLLLAYTQKLKDLYAAEKKYLKCFIQFSSSATAHELKTALSPETTELAMQTDRLKQCMIMQQIKPGKELTEIDTLLLSMGKEAVKGKPLDTQKDIRILHCAQTILKVKIAAYDVLYLLAAALKQEHEAMLLEQCSKDNQNTYGHLLQLSANVIYLKS